MFECEGGLIHSWRYLDQQCDRLYFFSWCIWGYFYNLLFCIRVRSLRVERLLVLFHCFCNKVGWVLWWLLTRVLQPWIDLLHLLLIRINQVIYSIFIISLFTVWHEEYQTPTMHLSWLSYLHIHLLILFIFIIINPLYFILLLCPKE